MAQQKVQNPPTETIVIDHFSGRMTQYKNGKLNSGLSSIYESSGFNPFPYPGRLRCAGAFTQIDSGGSVITDLVMAMKPRVESGITYVYAIGHTGRLYKIQVNDPTTYNPNYDNPVLLATLSSQSPTFKYGGSMEFYGSTEKIFIGHDKGVTKIAFDGTGETYVGAIGTWTQNVPRPIKQFVGKLYIGNGTNIAEIDSTETVTTYTKLSPSFPSGTQVRSMDVSSEGTYLQMIVSQLSLNDLTATTQDTSQAANTISYEFKWNGTDNGYTSFTSYPGVTLSANKLFQGSQYVFGVDVNGGAVYNPTEKIISLQEVKPPLPNAVFSIGNMVAFMTPVYYGSALESEMFMFGIGDFEIPLLLNDIMFQVATGSELDVLRIPCAVPVTNFGVGQSTNGYTNNIFSYSKVYYSTLETSDLTTGYKLYSWNPISTPFDSSAPLSEAVYQTQHQMFPRKIGISEVRVYGGPWQAGMAFTIDLINASTTDTALTNGSKTFTAGSNITVGDNFCWFNPSTEPTYGFAVRVTNAGTTNFVIDKIEVDVSPSGK